MESLSITIHMEWNGHNICMHVLSVEILVAVKGIWCTFLIKYIDSVVLLPLKKKYREPGFKRSLAFTFSQKK